VDKIDQDVGIGDDNPDRHAWPQLVGRKLQVTRTFQIIGTKFIEQ